MTGDGAAGMAEEEAVMFVDGVEEAMLRVEDEASGG